MFHNLISCNSPTKTAVYVYLTDIVFTGRCPAASKEIGIKKDRIKEASSLSCTTA
jgi:hypothetical protein